MEGRSNKIRVSERTKIFGDNLERARKQRGLTRQQLAAAVGINENTLSSYVLGKREPNLGKIFEFARVLAVSVNELTGDADNTPVFDYRLARAKELLEAAGGRLEILTDGTYVFKVPLFYYGDDDVFFAMLDRVLLNAPEDYSGACPDAANFVDTIEKILFRAVKNDKKFTDVLKDMAHPPVPTSTS